MTKKLIKLFALSALILTIISFCLTLTTTANADGVAEIAIEQSSGIVLYEKNADERLPMASTTKIMTALIICEDCNLEDTIIVPAQAVGVEGSSIYLKNNEEISVKDLLYGLMLRSGNDASVALALHHSGTVENFVSKMNLRAKEIGAENTHFQNPNGLPSENHYTTARDLSNITKCAMQNKTFKQVVSTKYYTGDFRNFTNKNKMLNRVEGANGVKTGFTEKAGRCLVSSVQRGDMDVICVVLNCYDMFERSEKIIERCFNDYSPQTLSKDKIFMYEGKTYALNEDCRIIVKADSPIELRILPATENNAYAILQIFSENNLIFSHNLYSINS